VGFAFHPRIVIKGTPGFRRAVNRFRFSCNNVYILTQWDVKDTCFELADIGVISLRKAKETPRCGLRK